MSSRVSIVTGATGKIGKVVAEEIARQGKHLIIACRSLAKSKVLLGELKSAKSFFPGQQRQNARAPEDCKNHAV